MSSPVWRWVFLLVPMFTACASTGPRPPATTLEQGYIPDLFGDRKVTYTQLNTEAGPVALIEGDIIVHPTKVPPVITTVVASRRNLWPGGIVPYSFVPGFINVTNARAAMVKMEAETPIRFVPRTTEPGFMLFKNAPFATQGSADVGYTGGKLDISIGMSLSVGGVMHEIGHVIGLDHEHNSPVRDQFVEVLIDNVLDDHKSDFDIATYSVSAVLRPYDFVSIMHYGPTTFGKDLPPPSKDKMTTMRRRDGLPGPLGKGDDLTLSDIGGIEAMYGPFAFMSHASGGFPFSGKSCFAAGPDPAKYPAFQGKTSGSVFCVDKATWLWSNIGLTDPKFAGLPPGSYRCLEISEPGDSDFSAQPNFLCYPFSTPMILTWSSSGAISGFKCVLFHAPEAGPAWVDDYLCYANGTVGAIGEVIRDASGRCLEVDGSGNAVMTVCGTLRWRRNDVSVGSVASFTYEPKNYGGDYVPRCLGTPGTTAKPGDRIILEPCSGTSDQDWLSLGGGQIQTGGYCMQVAASGAVYLNTCTGATNQQWVIRRTATTPF